MDGGKEGRQSGAGGPQKTMRPGWRLLIAAALVLAAGEILVRLWICGPSPQEYDPEIGYRYRKGGDLFQAKEGFNRLHLNALGLNDDEVGPKLGRCRVLVVGDSYTAALQVPRESNFTSVAERLDRRLDVVNAGRDGLFLGDLHKVAHRYIKPLEVDLVVYVISQRAVEADIHLPGFSVTHDPVSGAVTDAVMRVEGKEELKRAFEPVLHQSALATRLAAQLQPSLAAARDEFVAWRSRLVSAAHAAAVQRVASAPAAAPASDEAILAFAFHRFADEAPAALLYINAMHYKSSGRAVVGPTSARAEELSQKAAQRAGVPLFDTAAGLIESVARTGQPPYGFDNALMPGGHLNERGHAAVGRTLVDVVHAMAPSLRGCALQP